MIKRALPMMALTAMAASCSTAQVPTTAFTGATVWDGTGAPAVGATILVQDGRIVAIEEDSRPPRGAEIVDLTGRWVVPGLVDTHAHISGYWAPESTAGDVDRVREDLKLFARYGVTTVNSLGDDANVVAVRDAATGHEAHARVLAAGPVVVGDAAAARATAVENADMGVDWLKLRVDDNLGTSPKMSWDGVEAVMAVGRERGIPVATHLFYLEDAKRLVEMGTGLVAHSVRDVPVDPAFIDALRSSDICYVPTLTRELSTFAYARRPEFLDDPFFARHALESEVARVSDPAFMDQQATSRAAAGYQLALAQALVNLKMLSDAGVRVAMGTDAGPAARFPGYFQHLELQLMVDAGLSPEQVLRSATAVAAECSGADEVGTLEPGKWADFLVLGADPLADIAATKSLERVYVAGVEVR
jgi:imidazolonepropionase-like amidohydrolase